jgi:hypothetical protein
MITCSARLVLFADRCFSSAMVTREERPGFCEKHQILLRQYGRPLKRDA